MKSIVGKVVSVKMQKTAVVEITRFIKHPTFKKLIKRNRKFKVSNDGSLKEGEMVRITEDKKRSKDKYFKVVKE